MPQAADMNQGPWRHLENFTAAAANKFKAVWVIAGPIIDAGAPVLTIGRPGRVPVVVPNSLYKIVVREKDDGAPDALGFIFEQKPEVVNDEVVPGLTWVRRVSVTPSASTCPEPRPTSIDVLLTKGDHRVAVECKFTEAEFGTCSRPRLRAVGIRAIRSSDATAATVPRRGRASAAR